MDFNPVDSLVKEVMGSIRFLGNLLIMALIFLGVVGIVGLFFGILSFLK